MKIFLYYIGKPRDAQANAMAAEYVKRAARYAGCEMREIKPERTDPWARHPAARKIVLDAGGQAMDSPRFTALVADAEQRSQDLVFVVGGAGGLPPGWRERAGLALSLSSMTYAHELARVMLAEQIYRALATLRGHPYAR
ncbi:MAG: 23S rRNA (pseudouridine(1915)-N(3))-methyltransferase RlmH [Acidobacteriota bacterium]